MLYNVCGLSCGGCPHLGKECAGCHSLKGKVYWAPYTGGDICPIYHCCTVQNGWKHCGECPQVPCERWKTLKDPDESDEQFQQSVNARFRALRFAGAESDLQTIPETKGQDENGKEITTDVTYTTEKENVWVRDYSYTDTTSSSTDSGETSSSAASDSAAASSADSAVEDTSSSASAGEE